MEVVPVHTINLTLFRSRNQTQFKYSFLSLSSDALFMDEIIIWNSMFQSELRNTVIFSHYF